MSIARTMPRALCLLLALAAGGGALVLAPRTSPWRWARELVRPLALPLLWRNLAAAERSGTVSEAMAQARLLMQLLPEWADGHIHFAYRLVQEPGVAGPDPGGRRTWARLQAALAWLEEALPSAPKASAELLAAMAFLVEQTAEQEPAVVAPMQQATGLLPAQLADSFLERAEAGAAPESLREWRTFAAPKLAAAFLAAGNRKAALATVEWALARLGRVRDRELAARWRRSLENLRAWLAGDRSIPRAVLEDDPLLQPLHDLLPR